MAQIIVIRNWSEFQHYKDRDPPWIKLYRDTLTSEVWVLGTDISRLVQIASTLLAARYKNKTPMNYELWREVAKIRCSEADFEAAIKHLCKWKFAQVQEVADDDEPPAIKVLATCAEPLSAVYSEQSRAEGEQSRGRVDARDRWQEHHDWAYDELRSVYPSNLHTDAEWLSAARIIAGRLDSGETSRDEIHRLTCAFAAQHDAKGNRNTQWVESPIKHFDGRGKWRGPFALPAAVVKKLPETAMDRILAATSGHHDDQEYLEHGQH